MSIRNEMARFCTTLKFDSLPEDIVAYTKIALMDQIGLMIAGPTTYLEDFPNIADFMKDLGGKEESSIVVLGGKIPCLNATLVNTAFGISTSFDAVHKDPVLHLPAALFPAMIAVGEKQKATGKDLILAIVIGAEIMTRVALSLGRHLTYARAFHRTSICTPFACAAGAGRLLGLGEAQISEALSLSAVQAAGSQVWTGPLYPASWSFQVARAAQSGVMAALMAQIGLTGPDKIFEDERGFLRAYSENPEPAKLTEGLGERYDITGLTLKKFNIGIYIMICIDTLVEMYRKHDINVDKIEEIIVKIPTVVMPLVGFPEYPGNRACTHVSTRYILAVAAHIGADIEYNLEASASSTRNDPKIKNMFERIKMVGDPELDQAFPEKKGCILTIKTKDGKQISERNDGPFKGDPENPLSREDIETKFNKMTIPVLGREKASQLMGVIMQLDELEDVSQLVDRLMP